MTAVTDLLGMKPIRLNMRGSQRECCTCPAVLTLSLPDGEGNASVTDDMVDRAAWMVPVGRADGHGVRIGRLVEDRDGMAQVQVDGFGVLNVPSAEVER